MVFGQNFCSPVFALGCFNWNTQYVSVSNLSFTIGSDCMIWDNTSDTAKVNAGSNYNMTISNGSWCGAGVWIDYNNDNSFDTSENVFHQYTANQMNTYSFNFTIPSSIASGNYRMRVISGWGTDCFSPSSTNGFGPCGSYQYGNYNDFTISVSNTTSIEWIVLDDDKTIYPNPVSFELNISNRDVNEINIFNLNGKLLLSEKNPSQKINVSEIPKGSYFIEFIYGGNVVYKKFIKN